MIKKGQSAIGGVKSQTKGEAVQGYQMWTSARVWSKKGQRGKGGVKTKMKREIVQGYQTWTSARVWLKKGQSAKGGVNAQIKREVVEGYHTWASARVSSKRDRVQKGAVKTNTKCEVVEGIAFQCLAFEDLVYKLDSPLGKNSWKMNYFFQYCLIGESWASEVIIIRSLLFSHFLSEKLK